VIRLSDLTAEELALLMRTLGRAVLDQAEALAIERPLFALVVFNDKGRTQYLGNCGMAEMSAALREAADNIEQAMRRPPQHLPPDDPNHNPFSGN
jgi:hypothetical protein